MKSITKYINMKNSFTNVENVDEFPYNTKEERQEFKRCLNEYRISDRMAEFYSSSRSTKEWRDK